MIVLENGDKIRGDATNASEVDFTIHGLDNNTLKQLADGQLANSIGDLYTADSTDVVSSIILVNTGAAHNHVNLYLTPSGGTARRLIAKDLQLEPGYSLHFDGAKVMVLNTSGQIIYVGATGADGVGAWKQTTGTFTATPASTSTLTMTTDLTASILVGMSLKYVIGGVTKYGRVSAITANLLTVNGAPLGGDVTELYYGGGTVRQVVVIIPGTYEDANNTALIVSDLKSSLQWGLPVSYLVYFRVYSNTKDTSSNGQASVRINNTEVNTTAGGETIAAAQTWYSTIVNIAIAAYDINPGEAIEVTAIKGTTGDASDLTVEMIFVTP